MQKLDARASTFVGLPSNSDMGKSNYPQFHKREKCCNVFFLQQLDRLEDETMDSVSMEPRLLQKRVFMRGRPGGDAPKDRHAYIPQGPGTETTEERKLYLDRFPSEAESEDQGKEHVLQKRVFMRGRPGGDAPKDRHAYVPEKQRFMTSFQPPYYAN